MPATAGSGFKNDGSLNKDNKIDGESRNIINNVILGIQDEKYYLKIIPAGSGAGTDTCWVRFYHLNNDYKIDIENVGTYY